VDAAFVFEVAELAAFGEALTSVSVGVALVSAALPELSPELSLSVDWLAAPALTANSV
jgi:hypothetical protein